MYLYRATGKQTYRDAGWRIFQAIHKNGMRVCLCVCVSGLAAVLTCSAVNAGWVGVGRTPAAYSGVLDVTQSPTQWDNSMQSFFMAETLKYAYLLFSPPSVVPLDEFVFTTEAHPLRIWPH